MKIRPVRKTDINALVALHQKTAAFPDGVARKPHEISKKGISSFVNSAMKSGLCFVAENPENPKELIAEIHCFKHEPQVFKHTLGNLTIVVDPSFHGRGLGKKIFSHLIEEVKNNHPEIIRVELSVRENNPRAQKLYQSLGFEIEGVMRKRILSADGKLTGDVMMSWLRS